MLTHHILHQYQCLTQNDSLPCWKVHFDHRWYRNVFDGGRQKQGINEIFFALLKKKEHFIERSVFGSSKSACPK